MSAASGPRNAWKTLRWALPFAIVAGAWLYAPALGSGFRDDDYVQRAMLEGAFPIERNAADLFWFAGRDDAERDRLRDAGYLPWWSAPDLRLSMLRPLSSWLTALDHALWPEQHMVQHLHSLLWWALLLTAATLVFARTLPLPAATIACIAFAVEGAHMAPLAWLANRSTLIASTFAMLALWLHLKWREDAARGALWLSATAAVLALASGEYAFSVLGYIVAYELVTGRESLRTRALALLPVALPCIAYLVTRLALGHGAHDSGYYVSPLDPAFVTLALPRTAALTADLALGIPAHWLGTGPLWRQLLASMDVFPGSTLHSLAQFEIDHVTVGIVAFVMLATLYLWVRRGAGEERNPLGWLTLGALLSLVPAASALPSDRTLVGASFGTAALMASAIALAVQRMRADGLGRRWGSALLVLMLALLHLVVPAHRVRARAAAFAAECEAFRTWARTAQIPVQGVERLNVMVISASDFTTAANLPWLRRAAGLGLPRSYRRLSNATRPHILTRVRNDVLELRVAGDPTGLTVGSLYRPDGLPIDAGFEMQLPSMHVQVLASHGGAPVHTRFTFDGSLDDTERYLLLHATPEGLARLRPPPVSGSVRLGLAWMPQLSRAALDAARRQTAGAE